jgi:hypothetical protein
MKKFHLIGFLCVFAIFIQKNSCAQKKADDSLLLSKTSYWLAAVTYLSDNVYMGRRDSVKIPYITPSLGYYDKSGLYVNGSVSYLPTPGSNRIDLVTLEGGYSFILNNLDAQISASKYFFSPQSTNVRSEIKESVSAEAAYDLQIVKPTVQTMVNFGLRTDFALGVGLEHSFYAFDEDLEITPGFVVNSSTQNYYDAYYNLRRYNGKRKRKTTGVSYYDISADVSNASKFQLLDYELALPINYTFHKFTINFTPTLAVPVNPAHIIYTITPSTGSPYKRKFNEKLSNDLYFQTGISFLF